MNSIHPKAHRLTMQLIRRLVPTAPDIGAQARIHLGLVIRGQTWRNTAVGSPEDTYRACTVTGYSVELDDACGYWPKWPGQVGIIVHFRLHQWRNLPRSLRDFIRQNQPNFGQAHIGCLECAPKDCEY